MRTVTPQNAIRIGGNRQSPALLRDMHCLSATHSTSTGQQGSPARLPSRVPVPTPRACPGGCCCLEAPLFPEHHAENQSALLRLRGIDQTTSCADVLVPTDRTEVFQRQDYTQRPLSSNFGSLLARAAASTCKFSTAVSAKLSSGWLARFPTSCFAFRETVNGAVAVPHSECRLCVG